MSGGPTSELGFHIWIHFPVNNQQGNNVIIKQPVKKHFEKPTVEPLISGYPWNQKKCSFQLKMQCLNVAGAITKCPLNYGGCPPTGGVR